MTLCLDQCRLQSLIRIKHSYSFIVFLTVIDRMLKSVIVMDHGYKKTSCQDFKTNQWSVSHELLNAVKAFDDEALSLYDHTF